MENDVFTSQERPPILTEMSIGQFAQIAIAGLVAGLVAAGLTILFSLYLFKTLPCSGQACGSGGQYAAVLASVVSGFVALFWLMRIQVYRPLLIVIAATVGMWGIALSILDWPWYGVLAVGAASHLLIYTLFAWLSRLRPFWLVLLLLIAITATIRYILAS